MDELLGSKINVEVLNIYISKYGKLTCRPRYWRWTKLEKEDPMRSIYELRYEIHYVPISSFLFWTLYRISLSINICIDLWILIQDTKVNILGFRFLREVLYQLMLQRYIEITSTLDLKLSVNNFSSDVWLQNVLYNMWTLIQFRKLNKPI